MKSIIVYFSQTGNTQKIATAIQQAIKSATGQCDIIRLRGATAESLASYDLVGLGCPTFAHKEPYNVAQFIKRNNPKGIKILHRRGQQLVLPAP